MSYPMNELSNEMESLADDAGKMLDSTVNAAAKRYDEAREALDSALEHGKSIYGGARRRAIKDTRIVDGVIHNHIYQTIAIGIGVGLVLGYVLTRPRH